MNFEERAAKARRRGQPVRAAVVLIEGLKRHPDNRQALERLAELYVDELDSAGLGYDLTAIIARQRHPRDDFHWLLAELCARGKDSMGREIVRAAAEEGFEFEWPPPKREPDEHGDDKPDEAPEPAVPQVPSGDRGAGSSVAPTRKADQEATRFDGGETAERREEEASLVAEREYVDGGVDRPQPSIDHREESRGGESLAVEEQVGSSESVDAEGDGDRKSSRRTLWIAAVIVSIVALGGFVWWARGSQVAEAHQIDRRIESVDPADEEQLEPLIADIRSADALGETGSERSAFLRAVHAGEWGAKSASVPSKTSVWGRAAAATSHALQGDFEAASRQTTYLEHSAPTHLATHWALGFVAEKRGQLAAAVGHYRRGQKTYSEFPPFVTGQLRVHLLQARPEAVGHLRETLVELNPDNPYVSAASAIPTLAELEPASREEVDPDGERETASEEVPDFVRATAATERALEALARADYEEAAELVERALESEPSLGSALLVAGALRAASGDVEGAHEAFAELAELPGLAREFRWMLQVGAPRALGGAGRADLALQFVPPVKAKGKIAEQSDLPRPLVPLLSVEEAVKHEPIARQALLERAEVTSALGYEEAAAESLELLEGIDEVAQQAGLLRTRLAIRRGDRRGTRSASAALSTGPSRHVARAALAYHEGEYGEAIEQAREARSLQQGADDLATLRYLSLSLCADNRGREALALLDEAEVSVIDRGGLEALRLRVEGRVSPDDEATGERFERLSRIEPTSIDHLVDLAHIAFWRKDFEAARRFVEAALERSSDHPEVNWVRGLLEQIDDETARAKRAFRGAWRDDPDDPRMLIELGRMYLELDGPGRAHRVFYRALLRDRGSTDAVEGLGEAYYRDDPKRGIRDLSRIVGGYGDSQKEAAAVAAALKWLAVLHGLREGNEGALEYLDRAIERVGERPELLVERARYHEANGDDEVARETYARALEKNTTFAGARLGLARTALKRGDEDVARKQLERYLAQRPGGEHAEWASGKLAELDDGEGSSAE